MLEPRSEASEPRIGRKFADNQPTGDHLKPLAAVRAGAVGE
jgi:hypothetical protein